MSNDIRSSFISTLDHLPCDVIRSLWIIQSLNIGSDTAIKEYNSVLQHFQKQGVRNIDQDTVKLLQALRSKIKFYQTECEKESEILKKYVSNYKAFLNREIHELRYMEKVKALDPEEEKKKYLEYNERSKRSFIVTIKIPEEKKEEFRNIVSKENNAKMQLEERQIIKLPPLSKQNRRTRSSTPILPKLMIRQANGQNSGKIVMVSSKKDSLTAYQKRRPESRKGEQASGQKQFHQNKTNSKRRLVKENELKCDNFDFTVSKQVEDGITKGKENGKEGADDIGSYCYCKDVSYGDMIACDNPRCKIEWFHYKCVNLKRPPPGKWYCPDCQKKMHRNSSPKLRIQSLVKKVVKSSTIPVNRGRGRPPLKNRISGLKKEIQMTSRRKRGRHPLNNANLSKTIVPDMNSTIGQAARKRGRPKKSYEPLSQAKLRGSASNTESNRPRRANRVPLYTR